MRKVSPGKGGETLVKLNMEIEDLKKTVKTHISDIDKRLSIIESNVRKRNSWALIHDKIKANSTRSDESILELMTEHFGKDCLKAVIVTVAERYVKDFEDAITAQSCDLKMIVRNNNNIT